ncbi:MAG: sugar phosphate isomerase/epimerase [Clostridiales bacterium]|nr:sugar phosphate isomerase/epimerase [Clostridiales bacterium]MDY3748043.1 TIM barrel protein [Lachnospiraceae bacterium]
MNRENLILSNSCFRRITEAKWLNSLERLNIKQIEFLAASPYYSIFDYDTAQDRKKVLINWREVFREKNISVFSMVPEYHDYPVNLASPDQKIRQRSIEYYLSYIEDAAEMDVAYVYVNPGWYTVDFTKEQCFQYAVDAVKYLSDEAKKRKVALYIGALLTEVTNIVHDYASMCLFDKAVNKNTLLYALELDTAAKLEENPAWYIHSFGERLICARTSSDISKNKKIMNLWKKCYALNSGIKLAVNLDSQDYWERPDEYMENILNNAEKL